MTWSTPRAWAAGELVTAGNMNLYISDLLTYLKGGAGAVTIDNALTVSGTATITSSATIAGGTAWHSGNDGAGSGLDADVLDGMQPTSAATGSTVASRDANGDASFRYVNTSYINTPGQDLTTTIPTRIGGQGGDNYLRWYNETNWLRAGNAGTVRGNGALDLGQASAAGNVRRVRFVHAYGGAYTVSCTGSSGLIVGGSIVSSTVIASGDSYSFYACDDNYWDVV